MTETHKAVVEALDRTRQRIDDIKFNLDEVEKMFHKKALKHSFMDDNGFQVKHVHFKIDDWYKIADCLQFLWCNYDTIRNLMHPAAGEVKEVTDYEFRQKYNVWAYKREGGSGLINPMEFMLENYPNGLRITRAAATKE